jgi:hypothetical protein
MNEQFKVRANFVLLVVGFVFLIYIIKIIPSLYFDPVIYKIDVSGNEFLSTQYLKNLVMPVKGVKLSKLTVPSDPFLKSFYFKYIGNGTAELTVVERKPSFISSTSQGYFLTASDGVFLVAIPKDELYKFTGMTIFFGIESFNFNKSGIINPVLVNEIDQILSYPDWFKKEILEVDLKTNTIYFAKGVSIEFKNFNLDQEEEKVILSIVSSSSIGTRYITLDNNFIALPPAF